MFEIMQTCLKTVVVIGGVPVTVVVRVVVEFWKIVLQHVRSRREKSIDCYTPRWCLFLSILES